MTVHWLAESFNGDELVGRVGCEGDEVIAEWPRLGCLRATRDGRTAMFDPVADAPVRELEKLRRGPVRLLVHHLRGGLSLHGAAVEIEGRACVLLGASGQGKSTLAAALCERRRARLLGDDAVAIRQTASGDEVLALEQACWLTAEAAAIFGHESSAVDKEPFAVSARNEALVEPCLPTELPPEGASLVAIIHLDFVSGRRPSLERTFGLEAVGGVIAQMTRFIVDDPAVARRDLEALSELVARSRVYRLERQLGLEHLDEVLDLVTHATTEDP
jgi:hypothetical protein